MSLARHKVLLPCHELIILERQKACRPAYTPVHSDTPFAEDTTHRVDYTEKQIPERYHRTQEEYRANSAEFDDKTTYKSAYVPLEGERAKPIKPAYQPLDPNRAMTVSLVCLCGKK